jgi:hypothetical protein
MMLIETLLASGKHTFMVVKAHAAGPRRLFVAIEAYVHESKEAATGILAVDLDSLAIEVVHEGPGSAVDYLHVDGWHGLIRRDAVIELAGGPPTITDAGLGEPTAFGNQLSAIARLGQTTLVCGTRQNPDFSLEGFVARVEQGKLTPTLLSSTYGQPGPLRALAVHGERVFAAGDVQNAGLKYQLFDNNTAVPVGDESILALHARPDGTLLVGGDTAAWIYAGTTVERMPKITMQVAAAVDFAGADYWLAHDKSEQIVIWKRTDAEPKKAFKAKYQYIGYRSAPDVRMTATNDLLLVTNKDRIHIFDGKTWSQLALQANAKKPFKRLPAAMKK